MGNPPYSVGQRSANDNNQNESYPSLDAKIAETYARVSSSQLIRNLYDSYVRAFRWASDRIGEQGVVCFVSNAGWLRGAAMSGMRRCLAEEFDDVYVFDLRGNARTQGEERRREKDNVFGQGTRTPVAITLLVRHPGKTHVGRIHYHDIGDYLTREEKLGIVRDAALTGDVEWDSITPDRHGDWLDQRDDSFYEFAPMGLAKRKEPYGLFTVWSPGVNTARDAWVYNSSSEKLSENIQCLIRSYNEHVRHGLTQKDFLQEMSRPQIKWSAGLEANAKRGLVASYCSSRCMVASYRPFTKQFLYYSGEVNDRPGLWEQLLPGCERGNLYLCVSGGDNPSALVTGAIADFHYVGDSQCFPLYWYEEKEASSALFDASDCVSAGGQTSLFGNGATRKEKAYVRHDAITDEALRVFREAYPYAFLGRYKKDGGDELSKEDVFYYVYGILHSPEYRRRFASNLQKELPRIPLAADFAAFSRAGRALAELHLNYESVEPWGSIEEEGDSANPGRTVKMRFGKCEKTKDNPKGVDRTVLHVSEGMALRGIPEEAYGYVVNGRPAIEWLMDRFQVRTDKASGIVNDPNEYSDDPRYIVDLVKSVVTVSMETLNIVNMLPPLRERPQPANWPIAWKVE